jgi:hypothetical protein
MRPSRLAVAAPDGSRRWLIDTLRRRRDESWLTRRCEARERRPGEGRAKAVVGNALKGKNPREYPADDHANPAAAARNSQKGQSPETAADRAGFPLSGGWYNGRRNGKWVHPVRKAPDTF